MTGLRGFEVAVLRNLPGDRIALPFGGGGELAWKLKITGKQVFTNDLSEAATWEAVARVENNGYVLTAAAVEELTAGAAAHVAADTLANPGLKRWFSETEARWLEGYREIAVSWQDRVLTGLAFLLGKSIGDYLLSFDDETVALRLSPEDIVAELLPLAHVAVDNRRENRASQSDAFRFVVQTEADKVYARLPGCRPVHYRNKEKAGWTEVWVSGRPDAWNLLATEQRGRFGGYLATRTAYVDVTRAFLKRLRHFPTWAISIVEPGPLVLEDLLRTIEEFRPIETVYTKDATEFTHGIVQHIVVTRP